MRLQYQEVFPQGWGRSGSRPGLRSECVASPPAQPASQLSLPLSVSTFCQIRYLDNRIVANKGERYITVEDEEAVQRDKASHVSIKVITKRKGGKGYR